MSTPPTTPLRPDRAGPARPGQSRPDPAALAAAPGRSGAGAGDGAPAPSIIARLIDAFAAVLAPSRGGGARIVAMETADGFDLYRVAGRRARPLAPSSPALAAHKGPVEARLRPDRVLTRPLTLPEAGRDYFEAIIAHRLDRLTPWAPSQVVYGFAPAGEADAQGQVSVTFAATSAATAAAAEARLADLGLTATALGVADGPPQGPLAIDLWRGRRRPSRQGLRRRVGAYVSLAFILCGIAAVAAQWVLAREQAVLARVEEDTMRLRRALVERTAAGPTSRTETLLAETTAERSAALLIDRLAAALPDGTHLTALQITPGEVRLTGLSDDAPALIAMLEDSAVLQGVRFAAPVVRAETGKDSFDILATRRPGELR